MSLVDYKLKMNSKIETKYIYVNISYEIERVKKKGGKTCFKEFQC